MKKQIVERLFMDGHISFVEALELMGNEINSQPVIISHPIFPQQPLPYVPFVPNQPWYTQPQITC